MWLDLLFSQNVTQVRQAMATNFICLHQLKRRVKVSTFLVIETSYCWIYVGHLEESLLALYINHTTRDVQMTPWFRFWDLAVVKLFNWRTVRKPWWSLQICDQVEDWYSTLQHSPLVKRNLRALPTDVFKLAGQCPTLCTDCYSLKLKLTHRP